MGRLDRKPCQLAKTFVQKGQIRTNQGQD